jgi:hypothetical protein
MSVIARALMVITSRVHGPTGAEFQFKNAIMTLAAEAAILVPNDPQRAVEIFSEILRAISRVRYYRPKSAGPPQPRVHQENSQQMVFRETGGTPKCLSQQH